MTDYAAISARMLNGAAALREIVAQMTDDLSAIRKSELQVACRGYKAYSDAYDQLDSARKDVYRLVEELSRQVIPEMLTEADVSNITIDYGDGIKYRFGKNQRISCSMPNKEGGMEWLRENGGESLIQETVNASSLSSFAKEFTKTTGKDMPSDYFNVNQLVYTSVTKA